MPTIYKKTPALSVIMPSYNEELRLGPHLQPVLNYLHQHYPDYELIIVDDGSTDETVKTVLRATSHEPRAKLISYTPNRGKGYAVRTGVLASTGKQVLFMDADLSTPLAEIPNILKLLKSADIVIGSRGTAESVVKQAPLARRLASFIFDQIKYTIVGLRSYRDTQCGFKAYQGDIARKLFALSQVDRFMFDVEVLYIAQQAKLKVVEMPVAWADVPGSHVRFFEGVINMFRDLTRIRLLHSGKIDLS